MNGTVLCSDSSSHCCPPSKDLCYEDDFEMDDDEVRGEDEMLAVDDGHSQLPGTNKWDHIISALEDALLDDGFGAATTAFCRQHCQQFEDTAENMLCYTVLFQQYCSLVESTIVAALRAAVADFSMEEFADMLEERHEELGEEVLDFLMSMSDFATFKQTMLAYKREAEAAPQEQLLGPLCCAAPVHNEEQEDGEERPDLDMSLSISPLTSPASRAPAATTL